MSKESGTMIPDFLDPLKRKEVSDMKARLLQHISEIEWKRGMAKTNSGIYLKI